MSPYQPPAEIESYRPPLRYRVAKCFGLSLVICLALCLITAVVIGLIGITIATYEAITEHGFWHRDNALLPLGALAIGIAVCVFGLWVASWADDEQRKHRILNEHDEGK